MSYSEKLYRLPRDLITIFRNYEAIKRKEINAKWSAKFNETCILENLWPKFTDYISMTIDNKISLCCCSLTEESSKMNKKISSNQSGILVVIF